jgi:hypothetical protein
MAATKEKMQNLKETTQEKMVLVLRFFCFVFPLFNIILKQVKI